MAELVEPIVLRGRTAPSRVLFGPHETNLARRREISDRHVAYYARRAAGGAGVIVTEVASVHDSDWPYERAPLAADAAPGWAAVAQACRPHGALVLAGLGHAGGQGSSAYGQQALWAPSRVADAVSREVPMEIEQPEIDELVAGFGAAAGLAAEAGLDGVEIDAGQHSILRQFLSGLTNRRADGYGEDRTRLLREVLAAARSGPTAGRRSCARAAAVLRRAGAVGRDHAGAGGRGGRAAVAGAVDYLVLGARLGHVGLGHPARPARAAGLQPGLCAPSAPPSAAPSRSCCRAASSTRRSRRGARPTGVADLVEMTQSSDRRTGPRRARPGRDARAHPALHPVQPAHVACATRATRSSPTTPSRGRATRPRTHRSRALRSRAPTLSPATSSWSAAGRPGWRRRGCSRCGGTGCGSSSGPPCWAARCAWPPRWPDGPGWGCSCRGGSASWRGSGVEVTTGVEAGLAMLDAAERAGDGGAAGHRFAGCAGPVSRARLDADAAVRGRRAGGRLDRSRARRRSRPGRSSCTTRSATRRASVSPSRWPLAGRAGRARHPGPGRGHAARPHRRPRPGEHPVAAGRGGARAAVPLLDAGDGRAVLEHVWTGERREVACASVIDCGHRLPADAPVALRGHISCGPGDCVAPRTVHEAVLEARRAAAQLVSGYECSSTRMHSRPPKAH